MLNFDDLERYDTQKMFKIYDQWPEIASDCFKKKLHNVDFKNIDHIVFAGMGGSGTIGDIFSAILSKENIHVSVVKGYLLPKTVDSNTLVVTTSVTGNTTETLTILDSVVKNSFNVIALSSGGKIKNYCKKNNVSYYEIPNLHSPRASLTSYVYSILNVLGSLLPINNLDVIESISVLQETKKNISSENLTDSNEALSLASRITNIPLIYYPRGLQAAAIRFKNSLQENAKTHVMIEEVVEACHNGIVAWEESSNINPILIQGKDDFIKTKERWKIVKEYFETNNIKYQEVFSVKGNILSKLVNLIYLLDYASVYKAVMRKIDPSPVNSIDFVKERLNM